MITYMRTDGVQLSEGAVGGIRTTAMLLYGESAVHPEIRVYKCALTETV